MLAHPLENNSGQMFRSRVDPIERRDFVDHPMVKLLYTCVQDPLEFHQIKNHAFFIQLARLQACLDLPVVAMDSSTSTE